jgi:hypothetical protein
MDFPGWIFAYMEWSTTWLLLQREGRVWKEDLRQVYNGTLFWKIKEANESEKGWGQGIGWKEGMKLVTEALNYLYLCAGCFILVVSMLTATSMISGFSAEHTAHEN